MTEVIAAIVAAVVAAGLTFAIIQTLAKLRRKDAQSEAQRILCASQSGRRKPLEDGRIGDQGKGDSAESGDREGSGQAPRRAARAGTGAGPREESLTQQGDAVQKQERIVEATQCRLTEKLETSSRQNEELAKVLELHRQTLHKISGLSREDATQRLLTTLDNELAQETGQRILRHERQIAERCEALSLEMLLTALHRYAAAHTAESTTSTVDIPSDDMKGRIIGREGRNIRAFEKRTGVDVIIDDTPGVVIVSGFDPVRREIARQSLEKLIVDGRIYPSRIEEIVGDTEKEIEKFIRHKGEEAAQEVNVPNLHERLVYMLGRLHFRTSYSQNVLRHSVEVAFLAGMLAEMVGLNGDVARRCGLLHDIGKAADHELEGGHPKIGADLLKRHGEAKEIVHAALGHHDEIISEYPYTMLVATGDACSGHAPRAPGIAGTLHQADGRTGDHRDRVPRSGTGIRHTSRMGTASPGQRPRIRMT